MQPFLKYATLFFFLLALNGAFAYSFDCASDGMSCKVICDNGAKAGTIYWNGSKWSDGIRSDTDKNKLAKLIVAAQGTSCK